MNIEQLFRIFLMLAKYQNFSRVAEKMHLSQPAVSQHIKNLEQLYDVPLFLRARKITLTPAGEALVPYAEQILALYKESFRAAKDQKLSKTLIRVGTSLTIGDYILPQIVARYKKHMKDIFIQVKVEKTKEVIRGLLEDEIDVALVIEETRRNSLVAEPFGEDEIVLILSPEHPWADKQELGIEELAQANFIIMEAGSHKLAEETLRHLGIELNQLNSMELGSTEALKNSVENGLEIGIAFSSAVQRELQKGTLKMVRIAGHPMIQKFYWVTKPSLSPNKNIEQLKAIIFTHYDAAKQM